MKVFQRRCDQLWVDSKPLLTSKFQGANLLFEQVDINVEAIPGRRAAGSGCWGASVKHYDPFIKEYSRH